MHTISRCLFCFALLLFLVNSSWAEEGEFGSVAGRLVQSDGSPQQDALFFLFNTKTGPPPAPGKYFRFPDGLGFADDEGYFTVRVPPGEYWYGVIKRQKTDVHLTPKISDWLYVSRSVEGMLSLKVETNSVVTLGDILCLGVSSDLVGDIQVVEVSGVVHDQENAPLAGFFVEVFGQDQGATGSLFRSGLTAVDGRYVIQVAVGDYTFKIRRKSGRNQRGFRNREAEKYSVPKPVNLSLGSDSRVVDLDFTVRERSKRRHRSP